MQRISKHAIFSTLLALGLLVAGISIGPRAIGQTPTAEQLEVFKSLPPDQQQQILDQMGGRRGTSQAPATTGAPASSTAMPKQAVSTERLIELLEREPRLRAGDSLLLTVEIFDPEAVPPATPMPQTVPGQVTGTGVPGTTQAPSAGAPVTQAPVAKAPKAKVPVVIDPLVERAKDEYLRRLMDANPYRLDRMGRLLLQGVPPVVLAGLTAEEASRRLNADPQLRDFRFAVELLPVEPELKPFGYDLFTSVPTTFAPATDIPVPSEYVIGPGDTLGVQLIGERGGSYTLTVGRDGTVDFPQLGPIAVAGMKFPEAKQMLEQRVSEQMIGMRASVSMGPLRSVQVFVLGEAERPGSYTVSGLSTITNALFASGGVKPIGSLRNIQLKRKGEIIRRLDLYDLLLNGDTSDDVRLQPGDVIFIPPVGVTIAVSGEVQRPAIYEVREGAPASEVLYVAGGLTPEADPRSARLERIDGRRNRTVLDLDLTSPQGRAMALQTGDALRIDAIRESFEGAVSLEGHVHRPGGVQFRQGMRLTDVLGSLSELKPLADANYVLIRRETGPTRKISVLSADLQAAFANPTSDANVHLQARDRIYVFDLASSRLRTIAPIIQDLTRQSGRDEPLQVVGVDGRVKVPGQYPLEPGMTVSDLLRAGGGLDQSAYSGAAELIRYEVVGGEKRQTELIDLELERVLAGDPTADVGLRPFDFLVVKEMPLWRDQESIEVLGEVRFPGKYPIKRGETLKSIIDRAGGLTDLAFAEGSVFTRKDLKEREQRQLKVLADRLQGELATLSLQLAQSGEAGNTGQAIAAGQGLLADLKATEAVGRLVIDLRGVINAPAGSPNDVVVKDGDRLLIPRQTQEVTVIGEVQSATSHLYDPSMSRDEYIAMSGGMTQRADKGRVYVVRASGSVSAGNGSRWFSQGTTDIHPGDTIVVPLDAERMRPLPMWTAITTIIYNLAVAVAAVNSF